jgi:hypothetical protein
MEPIEILNNLLEKNLYKDAYSVIEKAIKNEDNILYILKMAENFVKNLEVKSLRYSVSEEEWDKCAQSILIIFYELFKKMDSKLADYSHILALRTLNLRSGSNLNKSKQEHLESILHLTLNKDDPNPALKHVNRLVQESKVEEFEDCQAILKKVSENGLCLRDAPSRFKKDDSVVLEAVLQNGLALQYASVGPRKNYAIVLAAIMQNELAFKYADSTLKSNLDFLLLIIKESPFSNFRCIYDIYLDEILENAPAEFFEKAIESYNKTMQSLGWKDYSKTEEIGKIENNIKILCEIVCDRIAEEKNEFDLDDLLSESPIDNGLECSSKFVTIRTL